MFFFLIFCFCVQNYVFLLKIVCKEKNIQKGNPKKLYVGEWILAQQSWVNQLGTVATVQNLKKKKKKWQSGSTKWHCRCIAQKHWMYSDIYNRKKKSTNGRLKKKQKCSYYSYNAAWYCNYCSKKKKTKWLTKMEL